MAENRDLALEISKLIGEPINPQLPVPMELTQIADTFTAEPGEHVWRYSSEDSYSDDSLDVDPNGVITVVRRTPLHDVELHFKGLNSPLDYVLVEDVLNRVDTNALARRKAAIARGMDKIELKLILDAIFNQFAGNVYGNSAYTSLGNADVYPSNRTAIGGNVMGVLVATSGMDLYDVILAAKHDIEDYGDNFVLLAGRTVKEKIDTYDKDHVTTFRYNITLSQKLKELGIDIVKIFGKISLTVSADATGNAQSESDVPLLDYKKFILVARDSRIAEGKPIKFVRRNVSPDIAKQMGAEVDNLQRVLIVNPAPVQQIISGSRQSVLAYGIYGYESIIMFIANPRAIKAVDCSAII